MSLKAGKWWRLRASTTASHRGGGTETLQWCLPKGRSIDPGRIIGDVYWARCQLSRPRDPIGFIPTQPPPSWLNWDLWLGPAPRQPYHANLIHYNWQWFWDFGQGEVATNGVHLIDVARWALGKGLPSEIHSTGGRFGPEDQAETPNAQRRTFQYEDGTASRQLVPNHNYFQRHPIDTPTFESLQAAIEE